MSIISKNKSQMQFQNRPKSRRNCWQALYKNHLKSYHLQFNPKNDQTQP